MRDPRAIEQLTRDLEAQLVPRVVAIAPQEQDGQRLFGDRRMREPDHRVVVQLGHHIERRPVLGILVPLALCAPRHDPHHACAVHERDAAEQLDGDLLGVVRLRALVDALFQLREVSERRVDIVGEIAHETEPRQSTKHEPERVSERRARSGFVAERDHRVVRRARELNELSSGRDREDFRATLARLLEPRQGLLGIPRVARDNDERVPTDKGREPVVAVDHRRDLELVGQQREREISPDRRSAHARDGDIAYVGVCRRKRGLARDGPRVAHLLGKILDAAEHVVGVRRTDALHALDHRGVVALCYRHR